MTDFDIKQIDEIVAIQILMSSYGIDCSKLTKTDIETIIELLQLAKQHPKIKETNL